MSNNNSLFGALWQIYTFPLVFMAFMSFAAENAGAGFYSKYYAFLIFFCIIAIAPFASECLRYASRHQIGVASTLAVIGLIVVWNAIVSGFNPFYSVVVSIVFIVGLTLFVLGQVRPKLMIGLMRAVILINVAALIYQYLLYGATGEVTYLHGEVFTFSRDRIYLLIGGGSLQRFTGLQLEPGSYSTMMALALIFYRSLVGHVDRVFVIGAITVPFTFATIAMIYLILLSVVLLFEVKWRRPRNFFLAVIVFCLVFGGLVFGGVLETILSRFDGGHEGDSSLNVKVLNVVSYMKFNFIEYWTGLGIEQIDPDCFGCNYVKSNGVIFYMMYSLGIVGIGIVTALVVRTGLRGIACFTLCLILLLCRYPVITPVFWVTFFALWNWPSPVRGLFRRRRRGPARQPSPSIQPYQEQPR